MKKITSITASLILTAAFAGAASAAPVEEPVAPVLEEPIVNIGDTIIAPTPIELTKTAEFFAAPGGKSWGELAPQFVHPTGETQGDWVEIYTWLGKAWLHIPGYVLSYS